MAVAEPPPKRSDRVVGALAVGLLVAAFAVQAISVRDARGALEHDEVITHLVVSGHLEDWHRLVDRSPPSGQWTAAGAYASMLDLDDASTFGATSRDLADNDVHPPLYYWLVQAARKGGVDLLDAGIVVNILAGAATILLLHRLLWRTFHDQAAAGIGTAVFVLSPSSALAESLARQYVLLALATTALLWTTTALTVERPRAQWWAALAAVTTAGLLTSYQFAYTLAGALAFLVVWPRAHSWRRRALPLATAALGAASVALVQPGIASQLRRAEDLGPGFSAAELPDRGWTAVEGLVDLVSMSPWADRLTVPAVAASALLVAAALRWHRPLRTAVRDHPLLGAAAATGGATLAGYLVSHATGAGPPHAVGRHYVAVLTVPLAVATGALVAQARSVRWRAVVAGGAVVAVVVALQWNNVHRQSSLHRREAIAAVADASALVADCASSGHLPGVAMWARDDTDVLLLPGTGGLPPTPPLDPAETLVAHSDEPSCPGPRRMDADEALVRLGLRRGEQIGYLGEVEIYRVEALPTPPAN